MVLAINGILVTAMVFGPAALAMLYAYSLNKGLKKIVEKNHKFSVESASAAASLIARLVALIDELFDEEEKSILYSRIDKLEAKHKSGGKELAKRAVKLKAKIQKSGDGLGHESRTLAPQIKEPKDMMFHMTNSKKKARKTRSK